MKALLTTLIIMLFTWKAGAQPVSETPDHQIKIAAGVSMLVASGVLFAYSDQVNDGKRNTPPPIQTKLDVTKLGLLTMGTFLIGWGIEEWRVTRRLQVAPAQEAVGLVMKF